MNFKNFSQAQFSKLRNEIYGVGEFRSDTTRICSLNFVSVDLEIVRGTKILHRHTHTHTHTERERERERDHGPIYKSCFCAKRQKQD